MNIQDIQTFAVLICLQYDYFYQAVTTCSSHAFDPNFSGFSPGNGSTSLQDDLSGDAWESGLLAPSQKESSFLNHHFSDASC